MSGETTFIHLTDLHVGEPSVEDSHLYSDTSGTLSGILAMVNAIERRPAFMIASGDLTNRGDAASYRHLKALMAATDLPVLYGLGNHDTRTGFYAGMLDRSDDPEAPYFHDKVIGGIHIITLDSSTPGQVGGTIEPEQFAWLEEAIGTHPQLPKLIVVHHAPALGDAPDWAHWRTIEFSQSQRLAEILKGRNVIGILSGHIHHDRVSNWWGIPVIVGTGLHAATDILDTEHLRMVSGASFGLCTLRRSGLTVAFVPLPSDRTTLHTVPLTQMRKRIDEMAA